MDKLVFRFKLRDLDKIEPWGKAGAKSLSWYSLTDACYCMETPRGKLLEHGGEFAADIGEPWCDYYAARPFE